MIRRFKAYSTRKKFGLTFLVFLLLSLVSVIAANRVIITASEGKTFSAVGDIPSNTTGLLLGTSRLNGRGEIQCLLCLQDQCSR